MVSSFPPIRACIFDVDGTLINTEDIYSDIYNTILQEYGKPNYPWKIKAIQQSRGTSIFGDDPEMLHCDKKPSPDIFLLALKRLNNACVVAHDGEPEGLKPEECLVFEDSIAGVEAARRAGMRVVWVLHPGLAQVCRGREMDVLMGRTEEGGQAPDFSETEIDSSGSTVERNDCDGLMSEDGWAEMRLSLEDFPYGKYGINV
ncbi:hypothetical protein N0V83_009359 [Neocucurbitaria cava]|uniref:Uncharacterized protein n=1 Tax=Neocucurbitaria cava TaxID=798079 RepID=A0A9W8Y0E6_9PLEO|nr:hypothetical protein N0V83_009359 [Neocucurbitaria cava]